MKTLITIFTSAFFVFNTSAQFVGDKVKTMSNQKVENKTDLAIDESLEIESEYAQNNKTESSKTYQSANKAPESDFIPGNKIIFFDDFSKDAMDDFPAKWNTNGSGKIVTIDGQKGRWLDFAHNSVVNPLLSKPLPENCTIEFDLFLQVQGERLTPYINFGLTPVKDVLREDLNYKDKFFVGINRYNESDGKSLEYGLREVVGNKNDFPLLSYLNKVLHVSMAINKTRIRVYFDQTKIIDLPRALTPELRNNFYLANMALVPASELGVLVTNVRIAASETDARSLLIKQLMEEGKAVTNDILFTVGSDVITKESFGIINQFGDALKANPGLKIKITGHTDSDGTAASNLDLSKKRAASVKRYLIANYAIDGERIQTDGKGASVPVSDNSTSQGKAKNRRVEFEKL